MTHRGKVAFELGQQVGVGAALERLGEERPAGLEHVAGERGRGLDQADDAELVGLAVTGGVGGHVGHHDVGAAPEHGLELVRRVVLHEVELREVDAGDLRHVQQIDRDDLALAVDRADALGGDLAPAARRSTEIDHGHAVLQQPVFVVDLEQLESGARAIAQSLGLDDIGIVELPLQPELRRQFALAAGLDLDVQAAGGVLGHLTSS